MGNKGIDDAGRHYSFDEAVALLGDMTYSDFCQFIDEFDCLYSNKIVEVLSYDDFSVFGVNHQYFYLSHELEGSSEDFYELKLIAELNYDASNDVQNAEDLITLFENTCCGEEVTEYGIRYLWFATK